MLILIINVEDLLCFLLMGVAQCNYRFRIG